MAAASSSAVFSAWGTRSPSDDRPPRIGPRGPGRIAAAA
jgi:hypothetical protein